jgi:hypothetical protein
MFCGLPAQPTSPIVMAARAASANAFFML